MSVKIEAGDITPDSLVWREGLDDWRPLRAVEELSDLVRSATQKMSDGLLGTMGRPQPAVSSGKVVPIAHGRPAAPVPSPARGGFDRPSGGNDEFADDEPTRMTSLAELVNSSEMEHPMSRKSAPPAAPSATTSARPVTGGYAPGARKSFPPAPPPAEARKSFPPPAPAPARKSFPPTPASAPFITATPAVAPSVRSSQLEPGLAPIAKVSPSAYAGPNDATVNVDPPSAAAFSMVAASPPTANPLPAAAIMQGGSARISMVDTRRRAAAGLPLAAWIMMAGVGLTGVAVGVFLSRSPGPAAPIANATPANVAVPVGRTVGAEIVLPPTPAVEPPPQYAIATSPSIAIAGGNHPASAVHAAPAHAVSSGPAAPTPGRGLTPAQLALLNSQLGGGGGGGAVPSGGPTTSTLANAPQASAPTGLSGAQRAGEVINALNRNHSVVDCWSQAQRRNPAHPAENLRVTLDVSPNGRARVTVGGASDPSLASCIQTRAGSAPYGAGGQVTAQASFNLVTGQ